MRQFKSVAAAFIIAGATTSALAAYGPAHQSGSKPMQNCSGYVSNMNMNGVQTPTAPSKCTGSKMRVSVGGQFNITNTDVDNNGTDADNSSAQINHLNISIDGMADHMSGTGIHLNLRLLNNEVFAQTIQDAGLAYVENDNGNFVADELYVTVGANKSMPFKVLLGRGYLNFGSYNGVYNPLPTLNQMALQTVVEKVEVAMKPIMGVDGTAFIYNGKSDDTSPDSIGNYGFKVNYGTKFMGAKGNASFSYLKDARTLANFNDSESLNRTVNQAFRNNVGMTQASTVRSSAYAVDLGGEFMGANLAAHYITGSKDMETGTDNSKLGIYSVRLGYDYGALPMLMDSGVAVEYDRVKSSSEALFNFKSRVSLELMTSMSKSLSANLQVAQYNGTNATNVDAKAVLAGVRFVV